MNNAAKRRLTIMGLTIVIVALVLFAVLGSNSAATALSVAQASTGDYEGKKVQVSGSVVADSYSVEDGIAVFSIADEGVDAQTLRVSYGRSMPATFGNGVTAICTGRIENGVLACTELVTKCPSKYESADGALTVPMLLANADQYMTGEVKLAGYVTAGTLNDGMADIRFNLNSQGADINIVFPGELPDGIAGGSAVVVRGHLGESGKVFEAVDVALDADVASQAEA